MEGFWNKTGNKVECKASVTVGSGTHNVCFTWILFKQLIQLQNSIYGPPTHLLRVIMFLYKQYFQVFVLFSFAGQVRGQHLLPDDAQSSRKQAEVA